MDSSIGITFMNLEIGERQIFFLKIGKNDHHAYKYNPLLAKLFIKFKSFTTQISQPIFRVLRMSSPTAKMPILKE